jgi:hypothetical protein
VIENLFYPEVTGWRAIRDTVGLIQDGNPHTPPGNLDSTSENQGRSAGVVVVAR